MNGTGISNKLTVWQERTINERCVADWQERQKKGARGTHTLGLKREDTVAPRA
jgi:hypothetical protein